MGRAYGILATGILGVLLLAGCGSTTYMSFGPESEAAVAKALATPIAGDVAMSVGNATYLIPASRLREEREALITALRDVPYALGPVPLGALEASLPDEKEAIVALVEAEVFEVDGPSGTLLVMREDWHLGVRGYTVGVMQGNEFLVAGTKVGDRIDAAWRRLAEAARDRSGVVMGVYEGHPERPLKKMREHSAY